MGHSVKVLFVCTANICRSPTAHGIFRALVEEQDLSDAIAVDSAGTHSHHTKAAPDPRSQATAREHGIDISDLRTRRFSADDFTEFDYLLAMDRDNLDNMLAIKPSATDGRACLLLDFSDRFERSEVPDPYFGGRGFDLVYDMIEDASHGLLQQIRRQYGL